MKIRYLPEEDRKTLHILRHTSDLTQVTEILEEVLQRPYTVQALWEYRKWFYILTKSDFYKEDGSSKITFKQGKETISLEYGVDFEIVKGSYKKNDKTGTATVTLRGLGEYGGTKTIKFKIMTKELYKK